MSGHSHWATIRRKKGAADAKRGQVFTKLAREIVLAARLGGGDLSSNVRLQLAIERARAQNMPKDNIERAIRRGTGEDKDSAAVEELYYEGYGPHGVAFMINCVTENRNRTVADLRHILSRYGGSLAEAGAVGWQFTRKSFFNFPQAKNDPDKIFELAVEAGADDVTFEDAEVEIIGPVESFKEISDQLHAAKIAPEEAGLKMVPNNEIELSKDDTLQVMRVIEALEDLDDVQEVFSNMKISEEVLAALEED
jgi:YebC/PmpR family DNA-binding regulatory protein